MLVPCASFSAFQEVCCFILGTSRPTRSQARSRLRCRRWSSFNSCEPSLLLYLVLDKALQHLALVSVGLVRLSLTFSSFFSCSDLYDNALTGTIPPQISTLTTLTRLYAPKWHIHECWSYTLLSVGPARLFLSLSSFFSCRYLLDNALTGTIPPQMSTLTKLKKLYAPKWHIH